MTADHDAAQPVVDGDDSAVRIVEYNKEIVTIVE